MENPISSRLTKGREEKVTIFQTSVLLQMVKYENGWSSNEELKRQSQTSLQKLRFQEELDP